MRSFAPLRPRTSAGTLRTTVTHALGTGLTGRRRATVLRAAGTALAVAGLAVLAPAAVSLPVGAT